MIEGKKIGICYLCNKFKQLTEHHIIPLKLKPTSKQVLMICSGCHRELNKLPHDWQRDFIITKVNETLRKQNN